MTSYASASSGAYRANAVLTASSPQLIVMLYDGARRFLHQASVAMSERDVATAHNKLRNAEHILRHLRNTLDMSQGQIPANLSSIYGFSLRQCRRRCWFAASGPVAGHPLTDRRGSSCRSAQTLVALPPSSPCWPWRWRPSCRS